jgi:hypothetical protein
MMRNEPAASRTLALGQTRSSPPTRSFNLLSATPRAATQLPPAPRPAPPAPQTLSSPPTGSFIVLFKTPQAATLAARSSVFPQQHVAGGGAWAAARGVDGAVAMGLDTFKVQQAPGPEDVLWQVGGRGRAPALAPRSQAPRAAPRAGGPLAARGGRSAGAAWTHQQLP